MPKVYVINDMRHSFEKAEAYGELVYVTKGKVPIFNTAASLEILQEGLKYFDVSKDYLLVTGHSLLCILAALIVAKKAPGAAMQLLVFEAKQQDYVVRHIKV